MRCRSCGNAFVSGHGPRHNARGIEVVMIYQQLINGLMLGASYALVAIGYTLIFGVLNLLYFAHGEVFMIGAFAGLFMVAYVGANIYGALLGAMVICGIVGVIAVFVAIRPVRKDRPLAPLISTIGRAIRATAENHETAALLGVDVNRVVLITFIIGSGIAGVAGVLDGIKNSSISPFMGLSAAVKGLIVMLLGGLGNVPGAMVAGIMLGMIEILSSAYIGSTERDFFSFLILIFILLWRPTGLFGTRTAEKR